MDTKIQVHYDAQDKVFNKSYAGKIMLESIFLSWNKDIEEGKIPPKTQKFIIDYSHAESFVERKFADDIVNFFKSKLGVFGNAKIAMVMKKPEQVIVPYIIQNKTRDFIVEVFYTRESALSWLNSY